MKILVCIKQVPDMESRFKIDADGVWYDTADLAWRMNEYDEYAVEQAVQLKEQEPEATLTVLSIGPDKVKETIKKALAMGCDRGVQIAEETPSRREPYEIASMIAEYSRQERFDLILTGHQSQDRGSGQVGVLVAEMLGLPCVTTVVECSYGGGRFELKRELEGGVRAAVALPTPALITCQLGLNTPRYPTLPNIMKAKKKELVTIPAAELLKVEGRQRTAKMYVPEKRGGGLILEGEAGESVDRLLKILKEKTGVLA